MGLEYQGVGVAGSALPAPFLFREFDF